MSYTLTVADIAALGASIPARTRIADPVARDMAKRTKEDDKRRAIADAQRAAERFHDYTPAQKLRMNALFSVHWPRARAISAEISAARARIASHFDAYSDVTYSQADLYDLIRREWRLSILLTRAYAASAAIGRFPLSRNDMRTDKGTILVKSAYKRHFTFNGGRDAGSREFDPADIVQGAFIRAIENGDTVNGVPTFGAMFRHVQSERAHLTRISNAEYAARKSAALGWTTSVAEEWPEIGDKHSMRLLGTRNYPTLEQHRASLADIHRDAELETMDDFVTRSARAELIDDGDATAFHVQLANLLMRGATIADVATALGLKPETISARALESRNTSLRPFATGIDHSQRSVEMARESERETEIANAQSAHAARLRRIELDRRIDVYQTDKSIPLSRYRSRHA